MTFSNKRKEERYPLCEKVEYILPDSSDKILQGLATNISKHGLCLHVYKMLDKGECISFRSNLDNSCQEAVLQWINEMDSGLYTAGFGCM